MSHPLFGPEIRAMLADDDGPGLRAFCDSLHPATVAEALDDQFTAADIWNVISPADLRTQAAIFEYLPPARQTEMVEGTNRPQVGALITKMSHDDRVDLLRRLPARVKESLLRLVDEADRRDIATLFTYAENSVGALMTTDYAWLPPTLTAAEAIDQLRQQAPDKETIYYIFILDEPVKRADGGGMAPRPLLGVISLRDLILAARQTLLRDLISGEELVAVRLSDDRETAADLLAQYDFIALPVLDDRGGMVGIVTHDDVIDVIRQEATEDLQMQAGVAPIEGGYLDAGFGRVWWSRVKWLAVVFVLQMGSIEAMAVFEGKLEQVAALAAFVPLCLSVGGNTGSQASSLVIRALALDEVTPRDWLRVFRRELLMGLALASALGVLALARTYFLTPSVLLKEADILVRLTFTVSLAVVGICLWGALLGAMLPVAIRAAGRDPALISSPAIATISDVSGIFLYFGIASLFFF
jgi:magnesium transporter